MKAAKGSFPRALDRPDPAIRFYLFYGPDEAGSRALALHLLKGLGDAEKFIVLGQAVKSDPAALADEAGAMALFGGTRALWIEPAGDEIADGVTALLEAPASESAVIALAGPLRKTSTLLKLAESHAAALAHCSYVPEGRDMERVVIDLASVVGLIVTPDLAQRLAAAANSNQAIAAQELTKFALFLGADPAHPKELGHDTVDLLGADAAEGDLMRLGDLALAGRMDELLDELSRLPHGGSEAIPVLRALQRRLLMLAPLRAQVERGERADGVMASLGKALFWKDKSLIQRLLSNWSANRLGEAASRVAVLERQILLNPVSNEAALGETFVTLARAARR
ncbi:MAG: DNA polymerase III subunit delta [Sphingomonas sp.]|uniref:DNA polymerase III subunit delta n=1 Tax=Sphingomonas sp. TaxID=28214 RepID=UPI0018284716|nr:DNA polymerase III subunit delta [Sphingomonas sp.]MBA3667371.1 DNA polymerase III subunit delta [Sphingomonas sp.]